MGEPRLTSAESMRAGLLHIGAAAESAGLSLRTVRSYEQAGLVRPSARTNGGFRLYSEDDVDRLLAVKQMKALGRSTGEMGELLSLLERSKTPELLHERELAFVVGSLQRYVAQTDASIERLERELNDMRELADRVRGQGARVGLLEAGGDRR